jgi:sugar lactone lactonase YvrE
MLSRYRSYPLITLFLFQCLASSFAQESSTAIPATPDQVPAIGTILTYAGNGFGSGGPFGSGAFSGDGGQATSAELSAPIQVAFGPDGNLYIADYANSRIRKVDSSTGVISTYAGGGSAQLLCNGSTSSQNFCGNGGPATSATLLYPPSIAFDSAGNLYIGDAGHAQIRKVDAKTGIITAYAGTVTCAVAGTASGCSGNSGYTGDGGPATSAEIDDPISLATDGAGNLYIADSMANVIRMVSYQTGIITTVAGGGSGCGQQTDNEGDGCPATQAQFASLTSIAVDSAGNIYIASGGLAGTVRRVDVKTGIISLFAGNGNGCSAATDSFTDGCTALNTSLDNPGALALDSTGNLYFSADDIIHSVNAASSLMTAIAGDGTGGFTGTGGPAISAELDAPEGIAFDSSGNLYFSDCLNNVVREVIIKQGLVAATPSFSPAGGTYSSEQSVMISDSTSGAAIYYTMDGSTPTSGSAQYTGPISVSQTTTLKAIAIATGYSNSSVATATYTITIEPQTEMPKFAPLGGAFTSPQSVVISDVTSGATIYFTTDGSTPTTGSTQYSGPIAVGTTETINAIAAASGYTNSNIATATFTINLPPTAPPTFSPAAGTYTSSQNVRITDSTSGAIIYYTSDGSTPTTSSAKYDGPIAVTSTETIKALAASSGYADSIVANASYVINLPAADFAVSVSPASLSVSAGASGNATVTITPQNGFSGAVSFACSGLPLGATCSFSPSTVTPSGGAASTALKITTSSSSASLRHPAGYSTPTTAFAIACFLFCFRRRKALLRLFLLAICLTGLVWLTGCGGGSSGGKGGGGSTTSTVTVAATSGSLQHEAAISLTVN